MCKLAVLRSEKRMLLRDRAVEAFHPLLQSGKNDWNRDSRDQPVRRASDPGPSTGSTHIPSPVIPSQRSQIQTVTHDVLILANVVHILHAGTQKELNLSTNSHLHSQKGSTLTMSPTQDVFDSLKQADCNIKTILKFRKLCLRGGGAGLAATLLPVVEDSVSRWERIIKKRQDQVEGTHIDIDSAEETEGVKDVLRICLLISRRDESVSEELGRQGMHGVLSRILKKDALAFEQEEDRDSIMEIQDLTCEIASAARTFPMKISPFNHEELKLRLPLEFEVPCALPMSRVSGSHQEGAEVVYIQQVSERQNSQYDVGFLMWPSAVVLSEWLAANRHFLTAKSILELGAGCGLSGLVAGKLLDQSVGPKPESRVILTDFNSTVVKNSASNIALNGLEGFVHAEELDFFQQDTGLKGWLDNEGNIRSQVDLILAADVICQVEDAFAVARTIVCALKNEGTAIVVAADSRHRYGA